MKRRQVLATTPLVAVAGCVDDGTTGRSSDDSAPADESGDDSPSAIESGDAPVVSHPSERDANPPLFPLEYDLDVENATDASPAEIVQIGETSDSHWVVGMADSDDPIATAVSVFGPDGGDEPVFETEVDLSRSVYVALTLRHPGSYAIEFEWGDETETVSVAERYVDCNSSNDSVLLDPDGGAERAGETTDQACD